MADDRQSASAASGAKGYKRSWKNLLINKRYQLRFTLFMVGVSAILMGILAVGEDLLFFTKWRSGERWWVMAVANDATEVASSGVRGECGDPVPDMVLDPNKHEAAVTDDDADTDDADTDDEDVDDEDLPDEDPMDLSGEDAEGDDTEEATPVEHEGSASGTGSASGSASGTGTASASGTGTASESGTAADEPDPDAGRHKVVVEESSMEIQEPVKQPLVINPDFLPGVAKHYECELRKASRLDNLQARRRLILWVLLASCCGMVVALGIYGIKMTHKVAGPLFKVTLYMAKMRDGRLDKVYNLRKGDELVAFYDHFKDAHAGVVAMEKVDIERLKAMLAAVDEHKVEEKSPELKAVIAELRSALARKEKSLE